MATSPPSAAAFHKFNIPLAQGSQWHCSSQLDRSRISCQHRASLAEGSVTQALANTGVTSRGHCTERVFQDAQEVARHHACRAGEGRVEEQRVCPGFGCQLGSEGHHSRRHSRREGHAVQRTQSPSRDVNARTQSHRNCTHLDGIPSLVASLDDWAAYPPPHSRVAQQCYERQAFRSSYLL